ncbi:MAG: toxin-antitoxin system protein [Actinomycetes bacterium]
MTATTIKVSSETRDKINALAAQEGLTAGSVIEKVLEAYLWRQRVDEAKRQMRSAPKEVWDEYMAEVAEWDASLSDGLEPYQGDKW